MVGWPAASRAAGRGDAAPLLARRGSRCVRRPPARAAGCGARRTGRDKGEREGRALCIYLLHASPLL